MSWQAASLVVLAVALTAGFAWYERDRPPSRVLALVATLAALAVVGRLAFAAVPNVKPTTDIVLFAGYALGAVPGFAVGAVTAVVSNVFLSQGPWTPWQMAGWGAVGVAGAIYARSMRGREPGRVGLALFCGLAGLAFGAWMDVYQLTLAARQDLDTYLALSASSLPYNLAHAIGNVVFCLLIGPAFVRALRRYRRRLDVRWRAPAGATAATLALLALALPAVASAASPAERAERYLLRAQNRDGGFGAATGESSSPLFSGWAGLGLAAAQHNPRDVRRRGGRSLSGYVGRAGSLRDIGEVERTALVVAASGRSARSFGGTDLIAAIERRRRPNGSIAGYTSYTAFGVLALRAAGVSAGRGTVAWLVGARNDDGGFGLARSAPSDADMTGAVLQALAVVGRARGAVARGAVAWLRRSQNADGGFGQFAASASNAQSTSYAAQGLVAVGAGGRSLSRALGYLRRLQRRDGSVAYSASSRQTPVWVTAQALLAFERAPLPLPAVPRQARPDRAGATPADAGGAGSSGADGAPGAPKPEPKAGSAPREESAPTPTGPAPGRDEAALAPSESGLHVDRARDQAQEQSGGGPAPWLVVLVLAVSVAALWLWRRRVAPASAAEAK